MPLLAPPGCRHHTVGAPFEASAPSCNLLTDLVSIAPIHLPMLLTRCSSSNSSSLRALCNNSRFFPPTPLPKKNTSPILASRQICPQIPKMQLTSVDRKERTQSICEVNIHFLGQFSRIHMIVHLFRIKSHFCRGNYNFG